MKYNLEKHWYEYAVPFLLDLTTGGKVKRVLWNYIFRQILLIGLLYMFICSLDFLSSAFRLLGGKKTLNKHGSIIPNTEIVLLSPKLYCIMLLK